MSSQLVSIAQNAASLTAGNKYSEYSKVILHVTDDVAYTVGNDSGMTMELTMPFGTRAMAQNILNDLTGYQYQSFDAQDALIDPAVQMGDAMDVNGIYGGIYSMRSKMGKLYVADVGAPAIKQINQKFQYKSSHDRQVARDFLSVYSNLSIHADQIAAEVEQRTSDVSSLRASLNIQADQIAAEVAQRKSDVESLISSVTMNAKQILAEVEQRTKDVGSLRASLDIQAGQITAEIKQRKSDVSTLNTKVTQNAERILAEVDQRTSDVGSLRASLDIHSTQIAARVSKDGGDHSSFGWSLHSTKWALLANNREVLTATKDGVQIDGKITARSGKIGGFDIHSNRLLYNNLEWGGTNTIGIYIGPNGIQLGKKFKVDNSGNLYASTGTFTGAVRAGNVQYGGDAGYFNGSGITGHSISGGRLEYGTVSTSYTSGGINSSLANADFAADVVRGLQKFGALQGNTLLVKTLNFDGKYLERRTIDYKQASGANGRMQVICWKS